jgi:excisionase family DNA binding protein
MPWAGWRLNHRRPSTVAPPSPELICYTTAHVARLCNVKMVTVRHWIKAGKLNASQVGHGRHKITAAELERFLSANPSVLARVDV